MALKNLSIYEMKNKLFSKGISRDDIDDYFYENKNELEEYEENSKKNIISKKSRSMDEIELKNYLYKKGYRM